MVAAVSEARRQEGLPVIVAPLEKLSADHFGMARMVSRPSLFFINDDQWRKDNPGQKIRLPFSFRLTE